MQTKQFFIPLLYLCFVKFLLLYIGVFRASIIQLCIYHVLFELRQSPKLNGCCKGTTYFPNSPKK